MQAPTTNATREVAVYVHFPWCLQRCPYCDFATEAIRPLEIPHAAYGRAVRRELDLRAECYAGLRARTVFFGGGTPSLWDPQEIARVVRHVEAVFGAAGEVTVECNPSSLDANRARALVDGGVTRLSIGVQSLRDRHLRFLGRLHDSDGARAAIEAACAVAGLRVSVDVMFGSAGQQLEETLRDLDEIVSFGVRHVSAYSLTIEPRTRFGELARAGRLPRLGDDAVADLYLAIEQRLGDHGFEHYEVSNYAMAGERAAHNVAYWLGRPYLGLGAGAVGCATSGATRAVRTRNDADAAKYIAALEAGRLPVGEIEELGPEELVREGLMLGLRTADGVDLDALRDRTGVDPRGARAAAIAMQVARGNLVSERPRLRIPRERWLLSDDVIARLF